MDRLIIKIFLTSKMVGTAIAFLSGKHESEKEDEKVLSFKF
jgi:hypothetical protein